MPKLDLASLPLPEAVSETKTFTDALQPTAELVVTFDARPDASLVLKAQSLRAEYIKEHTNRQRPPISVNKRPVKPSPELCAAIAVIQALERPQDDGSRYAFEEWVGLSILMPNAFLDVVTWSDEILGAAFRNRDDDGNVIVPNASAERVEDTSAPPQSTTEPAIPTLSPETTASSSPSIEPSVS